MSIKKSIYYRSKSFVEKEDYKNLLKKNSINVIDGNNLSKEIIETLETVKNYINNSNVLIDIGTHKGLFSKAADLFFNFEKIICIEPNEGMNKLIKNNINSDKLLLKNVALSDQKGEISFFLHEDSSMNSIVESNHEILKNEFPYDNPDKIEEIKVKTDTLDNVINESKLDSHKYFIKIDTQGNELNVLKNGISTLKNTEVCLIEYMFFSPYESNYDFYDLVHFMKENDFVCLGALTIFKRPSKKISGVDFLFVKK